MPDNQGWFWICMLLAVLFLAFVATDAYAQSCEACTEVVTVSLEGHCYGAQSKDLILFTRGYVGQEFLVTVCVNGRVWEYQHIVVPDGRKTLTFLAGEECPTFWRIYFDPETSEDVCR